MVSTRAMNRMASVAEEKKDCEEYYYYLAKDDRPRTNEASGHDLLKNSEPVTSTDDNDASSAPKPHTNLESQRDNVDVSLPQGPPAGELTKKSPLLLLMCASGITSCYLWYGVVQEHLFRMENAGDDEREGSDNESITLFFLAAGTFSCFLLAWLWSVIGPVLLSEKSESKHHKQKGEQGLNHPLIIVTSLTYLSAMAASNESLHYVSYPTCVLAKSSKLIPTMVVGWAVDRWRVLRNNRSGNNDDGKHINAMEWIGAALITVGILSFQYIQLQKQTSEDSRHDGKEVKGDSRYGLALLGLSLFMDGLLGACQSALKQKDAKQTTTKNTSHYRSPSAMESMLYINLYATLLLLPISYYAGQFHRGLATIFYNSNDRKSVLFFQLIISSTLGQVFIFLTIHHFSPLTCTTITTTRKFLTILFSVYKFGHVLGFFSWMGIGLVFTGLYLQIAAKCFDRGGVYNTEKKKVE